MIFWERVNKLFKKLNFFKFRNGIKRSFFEQGQIVLDHFIAKGMKSVNIYFVSVGSNKLLESFSHRHNAGIGVGQTKYILRISICF